MSRPRRRPVCALVSGGADSAVLVAEMLAAGREVHPLYVRCGYLWERAELFWLRKLLRALEHPLLKPLSVAELPMGPLLGEHWGLHGRGVPALGAAWDSVFLPGRNALLLTVAAVFAARRGIGEVCLGVLEGNPFPDASPRFLKALQTALRRGAAPGLVISAPFRHVGKRRLLARHPGLPLHLTFSCLKPRGVRACGRCSKCEELSGARPRPS